MEGFDELIERFLANKLEANELKQFQQQLENNPALRNEVEDRRQCLRFDDYLSLQMSETERSTFEQELEKNDELRAAFNSHKEAHNLISANAYFRNREFLEQVDQENPRKTILPWRKMLVAACLVLLVGLGIAYLFWTMPNSSTRIAQESFEPYPIGNTLMGHHTVSPSLLQEAKTYYSDGNYAEAIDIFIQIPKSDSSYAAIQFYLGNALLAQDQYEKAVATFQNIDIEIPNSGKFDWYKSLAFLGNGQETAARKLLEKIRTNATDSYYKDKADSTLKRLINK